MTQTFMDELVDPGAAVPEHFFDRFMVNGHAAGGGDRCFIVGAGRYPAAGTTDGFALVAVDGEQRNLRFSTELDESSADVVGPLSWQVLEPMNAWRVTLGPNPVGFELDLTWRARTPAWFGDVVVREGGRAVSSFEHLFQSGRYEGWLSVDGDRWPVAGWYGQRDRSRGVRTLSGGQGLHLWVQMQFPDRCVGFLLVEDRAHRRLLLEGAVLHAAGGLDPIVDVRHALVFDEGLDLRSGAFEVVTASGERYPVQVDAGRRGFYMAGGGYGGHHGRSRGRDHVEHDVYPLDGTVSPRALDTPLTDRPATFTWGPVVGSGILEFAHSRSRSYGYAPSI